MNPDVDFYFNKAKKWQEELRELRAIMTDTGLAEVLKWGCPCYTHGSSNIVLIHAFKEYCALLFMKGALLQDPQRLLIQQTENVQSARQFRFTGLSEIKKVAGTIKAYVFEAVEVEEAGLKVERKRPEEYAVPDEFQQKLDQDTDLKEAFYSLTPGRQRAYLLHFSAAKQSKTRADRVEKCRLLILDGKGLND